MDERKLMLWSLYARRAAVIIGIGLLACLIFGLVGCEKRDADGNIIPTPPKPKLVTKTELVKEAGQLKSISVRLTASDNSAFIFSIDNEADAQSAIASLESITSDLKSFAEQIKPQ